MYTQSLEPETKVPHEKQMIGHYELASSVSSMSTIESQKSFEKRPAIPRKVSDALEKKGLEVDVQGVVRFAQDSTTHPRQWTILRKSYDSAIIIFLEFSMTLVSNTGSSIAPQAAEDFGISRESALFYFTTLYLIGQAIGGLVFPPIAESFGGRAIYLTSTFGFAVFCLITAYWPQLYVVIVCRLMTGLLSAMPAVVAAGSIENMWNMKSRAFLIHIWIGGAVVGLALGPPVGTYITTSSLGWPWVFGIAATVTGVVAFLCFGMTESRPAQVLRKHVKVVANETSFDGLSLDGDHFQPRLSTFLRKSLFMPLRLFFTEWIVALTSIMAATVYGIIYLFSEALAIVYVEGYGFRIRQGSLIFLAIGAGVIFTFLPRLYDIHVTAKRLKQGKHLEPEDKLFGFFVAAPVLAIGLWWFAYTVPPMSIGVSPWVSIASLVLIGFSVVEFDNVLSGYLCDTYATYAASANAPMAFLRAILSGVFPLIGQRLFRTLGSNKAVFILAIVATVYCAFALLFFLHGKKIREKSPLAEKTWAASQSNEKLPDIEVPVSMPKQCVVAGE